MNHTDLRWARLQGADLSCNNVEAAYYDSKPRCTILSSADLRGTKFTGAILRNADLAYSHLGCIGRECTNLDNADLRDVDWTWVLIEDGDRIWSKPPEGWEYFQDDQGGTRLRRSN